MTGAGIVVFLVMGVLVPLAICSDSARRERALAAHPSNHTEFDDAEVHDLHCERCGRVVYRVATCGYDLLVVLKAEREAFDLAVDWHRDFECQRVSA